MKIIYNYYMKTNHYLLGLALLVVGTMLAFSQVSNDNEDEVYKIDARAGQNAARREPR
jgi:hypothetical protein